MDHRDASEGCMRLSIETTALVTLKGNGELAVIDGGPVLIPVNQGQVVVVCAAEVRVREQSLIGHGS
jgi:hypothetical protein